MISALENAMKLITITNVDKDIIKEAVSQNKGFLIMVHGILQVN